MEFTGILIKAEGNLGDYEKLQTHTLVSLL